jgi:type IV secretory pathway VirB2 component (pilin)
LLLVLEASLLQLYTQELITVSVTTLGGMLSLTGSMLGCLEQHSGAAASAEAASVLLQALVQFMPQAMLHAAAAAGCEGLRPVADERVSAIMQAFHGGYAKLVVLVAVFANPSEWKCSRLVA